MVFVSIRDLIFTISLLAMFSCGSNSNSTEEPSEEVEAEVISNMMAAASPIYMQETKTLSIAPQINLSSCMSDKRFNNLGIFGGLWRYSCAISRTVGEVLFGQANPYSYSSGGDEAPVEDEGGGDDQNESPSEGGMGDTELRLADKTDPCAELVKEDKGSFFAIMCSLPRKKILDAAFDIKSSDDSLLGA